MTRARRTAMIAGAVVAVAVFAVAALRPSDDSAPVTSERGKLLAPAKRQALPAIAAATVVPPPARLDLANLRGQPLFIDVWASWCPSCEKEAPMLARLAREHRGRIRFIGIDTNDGRGAARAFIRRHRLDYPHLFDPTTKLARRLGVYGIPTMFLVDRQGRVAATLVGPQPEAMLRTYLRLLSGEGRTRQVAAEP